MGRSHTGAITTGEAQRIELSYLLKQGFIKNNAIANGTISWSNGNSIGIEVKITNTEKYIRLHYTNTNYEGIKKDIDTLIRLESIPSNLGKGNILYFICPFTYKRCRILYKTYGSLYFKSRKSYSYRIYYSSQVSGKNGYNINRSHSIEKILDKLYPLMKKSHYKGKETRIQKRINLLELKKREFDFEMMLEFERRFSLL